MRELISKLQYKNFEIGEFIEEHRRAYDETIKLIENFPWNAERENIKIDLTNPSVTIEGEGNDYLKLAVFYSEKYALHYLNDHRILFTKSFTDFKDSYKYIADFFELPVFDVSDFKQENTWLKENLAHFVSKDFNYTVNPKSIRHFLLSTSGFNFCFSLFFLLLFLIKGIGNARIGGTIAILIAMFIAGGGLNLVLFFNYYRYAKNKILIMSKGNDIFYFGDKNAPKKFDKKDILQYTTTKSRSSRSPINGFAVVKIDFRNGEIVLIPNLLVNYSSLEEKLYQCKRIDKSGIPMI